MLHVWARVRGQIHSRRASLASTTSTSTEPAADPEATVPMAEAEEPQEQEEFDEMEFLQELESGMDSLTLEAYGCCQFVAC